MCQLGNFSFCWFLNASDSRITILGFLRIEVLSEQGSAVGAQEKKVSSDNGVGTPDIHQLKL